MGYRREDVVCECVSSVVILYHLAGYYVGWDDGAMISIVEVGGTQEDVVYGCGYCVVMFE